MATESQAPQVTATAESTSSNRPLSRKEAKALARYEAKKIKEAKNAKASERSFGWGMVYGAITGIAENVRQEHVRTKRLAKAIRRNGGSYYSSEFFQEAAKNGLDPRNWGKYRKLREIAQRDTAKHEGLRKLAGGSEEAIKRMIQEGASSEIKQLYQDLIVSRIQRSQAEADVARIKKQLQNKRLNDGDRSRLEVQLSEGEAELRRLDTKINGEDPDTHKTEEQRIKDITEGNATLEGIKPDEMRKAFDFIAQQMLNDKVDTGLGPADSPYTRAKFDRALESYLTQGKDAKQLEQLRRVSQLNFLNNSSYLWSAAIVGAGVLFGATTPVGWAAFGIGLGITAITAWHRLRVDRAMRAIDSARGQVNIRAQKDTTQLKRFGKKMAQFSNAMNVDWEKIDDDRGLLKLIFTNKDVAGAMGSRIGIGVAGRLASFLLGGAVHAFGETDAGQAVGHVTSNIEHAVTAPIDHAKDEVLHKIFGNSDTPKNPQTTLTHLAARDQDGSSSQSGDATANFVFRPGGTRPNNPDAGFDPPPPPPPPDIDKDVAQLNADLQHPDFQTIHDDIARLQTDSDRLGISTDHDVKAGFDKLHTDVGSAKGYGNDVNQLQYDIDKALALQELTKENSTSLDIQHQLGDLQTVIHDAALSGNTAKLDIKFHDLHEAIMKLPPSADRDRMLQDLDGIHSHYLDQPGYQNYVDDITKLLAKHEIQGPSQADQNLANAGVFGGRAATDGNLSAIPDALGAFGNLKDYIGNGGIQETLNQIFNHNSSSDILPFSFGGAHPTDVVIPGFGHAPVTLPDGWHVQGGNYVLDAQNREVGYFNVENNQISFQATGYDGITAGDHIVGNISGNNIVPTGSGAGAATAAGSAAADHTVNTAAAASTETSVPTDVHTLFGTHNPAGETHTAIGDSTDPRNFDANVISHHPEDASDQVLGTWQGAHVAFSADASGHYNTVEFYGTYPGAKMEIQIDGHYYVFDQQSMTLGDNHEVILTPVDGSAPVHMTQDSFLTMVGYGNPKSIEAAFIIERDTTNWLKANGWTGTHNASDRIAQYLNGQLAARHEGLGGTIDQDLAKAGISRGDIHYTAVPMGEGIKDGNHLTIIAQNEFVDKGAFQENVTISHDLGEAAENYTGNAAAFDQFTDQSHFFIPGELPLTDWIADRMQFFEDNPGWATAVAYGAIGLATVRGFVQEVRHPGPQIRRTLWAVGTGEAAGFVIDWFTSSSVPLPIWGLVGYGAGRGLGVIWNRVRPRGQAANQGTGQGGTPPPGGPGAGANARTPLGTRLKGAVGGALGRLRPKRPDNQPGPDDSDAKMQLATTALTRNGRGDVERARIQLASLHDDNPPSSEQLTALADVTKDMRTAQANNPDAAHIVAQQLVDKETKGFDLTHPANAALAAGAILGAGAGLAARELAQHKAKTRNLQKAIQKAAIVKKARQSGVANPFVQARSDLEALDGVSVDKPLNPGQAFDHIQLFQRAGIQPNDTSLIHEAYQNAEPEVKAVVGAMTSTQPQPEDRIKEALTYADLIPKSGQNVDVNKFASGVNALRKNLLTEGIILKPTTQPTSNEERNELVKQEVLALNSAIQKIYGREVANRILATEAAEDWGEVDPDRVQALNTAFTNYVEAKRQYDADTNTPKRQEVQDRLNDAYKKAYPVLERFFDDQQQATITTYPYHNDFGTVLEGIHNAVLKQHPDWQTEEARLDAEKAKFDQEVARIMKMEPDQQQQAGEALAAKDTELKNARRELAKKIGPAIQNFALGDPAASGIQEAFGDVLEQAVLLANGGLLPGETPPNPSGTGGSSGGGGASGAGGSPDDTGASDAGQDLVRDAQQAEQRRQAKIQETLNLVATPDLTTKATAYNRLLELALNENAVTGLPSEFRSSALTTARGNLEEQIRLAGLPEDIQRQYDEWQAAKDRPDIQAGEVSTLENTYKKALSEYYNTEIVPKAPQDRPEGIRQAEAAVIAAVKEAAKDVQGPGSPDGGTVQQSPDEQGQPAASPDRSTALAAGSLAEVLIPDEAQRGKILQAERGSSAQFEVVGAVIQGNRTRGEGEIRPGEDKIYVSGNGRNVAVLDGMGGYGVDGYGGKEASQIAKTALEAEIDNKTFATQEEARKALERWALATQKGLIAAASTKFGAELVGITGAIAVQYGDRGEALVLRIGDPEVLKYNSQTQKLEFVGEPQSDLATKLKIQKGQSTNLTQEELLAIYRTKNDIKAEDPKYTPQNAPVVLGKKNIVVNSIDGRVDTVSQAPVKLDLTNIQLIQLNPGDSLVIATDGATEGTALGTIDKALSAVTQGQTDASGALKQILEQAITQGEDDAGSAVIVQRKITIPGPSRPVRPSPAPGAGAVGQQTQSENRPSGSARAPSRAARASRVSPLVRA